MLVIAIYIDETLQRFNLSNRQLIPCSICRRILQFFLQIHSSKIFTKARSNS